MSPTLAPARSLLSSSALALLLSAAPLGSRAADGAAAAGQDQAPVQGRAALASTGQQASPGAQAPGKQAAPKPAQGPALRLNALEYLEMPGLNVMLAHDYYPESHQGGVGIIQNGLRVATNGDLRLESVPGQWQPVPSVGEREVDRATGEVRVRMKYPDTTKDRRGFNPIEYPDLRLSYTLRIIPEGAAFRLVVDLDEPLPAAWVGRVGLNIELFPGILFGKAYSLGGYNRLFPRQDSGPRAPGPDGVEPAPLARGPRLLVAPGDPRQALAIEVRTGGEIQLLDGRARHSNGWYVVRSLVPAGATRGAVEWLVTPQAQPGWLSEPVIQVSQVGYHPAEPKVAVLELDRSDSTRHPVELLRSGPDGALVPVLSAKATEWGDFLRYHYLQFDFTQVREPGVYVLRYGAQRSSPFVIGDTLYRQGVWQPTLEYFLPVQMCHMRINDRYRVWHGACNLDDARMAPVNHNHFDGYLQGPSTLSPFKPGEHVPGLDRGGWHDAGDYDLRVESQAETLHGLALARELFGAALDNTSIDQSTRVVELQQPDGKPDILQQIEHGALSIVAGHKALGRLYRGVIEPTKRQYTHLGDAATMTDNLPFSQPAAGLAVPPVGQPGSPDDRWVFTEENPRRELQVASGLASSARVLRDFNPALAADCLRIARELWESAGAVAPGLRLEAAVELLQATQDPRYVRFLVENVETLTAAPGTRKGPPPNFGALARSASLVSDSHYRERVRTLMQAHAARLAELGRRTPYGVPYEPDIWGAGWGIQAFGREQYFLHSAYPDLFPAEPLHRALQFILGAHPGSNNASFVSGVGSKSVLQAYGVNRGDASHIPGGSVSGTALIRPDFPELLEWPFLWQQTEYCLGAPTSDYVFLVLAADSLLSARK